LYEFMATHRDDIVARTADRVRGRPWPSVSTGEIELCTPPNDARITSRRLAVAPLLERRPRTLALGRLKVGFAAEVPFISSRGGSVRTRDLRPPRPQPGSPSGRRSGVECVSRKSPLRDLSGGDLFGGARRVLTEDHASCKGRAARGMAERVGFEPTCRLPDKTLSRRPRYDHFGTSPGSGVARNVQLYTSGSPRLNGPTGARGAPGRTPG
jgi:hypothetical protein